MFFYYSCFESCLSYLCIVDVKKIIKHNHMTKYIVKIRSLLANTSQSHLKISIYKFLQSFLVILPIISLLFFFFITSLDLLEANTAPKCELPGK